MDDEEVREWTERLINRLADEINRSLDAVLDDECPDASSECRRDFKRAVILAAGNRQDKPVEETKESQ